jgi:RNA polymerase sigma-70 factor (ECF subfamily)
VKKEEVLVSLNNNKVELFKLLHTLNETSKEVLYLRLTGELSFSEIGDIWVKQRTGQE